MKWAVGVMAARRPISTWRETAFSLQKCGWNPTVFAEADVVEEIPYGILTNHPRIVRRPQSADAVFTPAEIGPNGEFGNFQNFVQTLADLLWLEPTADVLMVVEDDALFNANTKRFVEEWLWPERHTGMMSLYCPESRPFHKLGRGLHKMTWAEWYGSLAVLFPREVVIKMLNAEILNNWQTEEKPWRRRGGVKRAGKMTRTMGLSDWCFCPSLVKHYSPVICDNQNSSYALGSGMNIGPRQAMDFIGENTNPWNLFPRKREPLTLDKLKAWDENELRSLGVIK